MYSTSLNCVFVHVPRTGGTSVSLALAKYFDDVVWKPDGSIDPDHRSLEQHCEAYGFDPHQVMSFAFVRNPWDRYVSFYEFYHRWHLREGSKVSQHPDSRLAHADLSFEAWMRRFVEDKPGNLLRPSSRQVRDVKYVGQFERLQESFDELSQRLGLPSQTLPRVNRAGSSRRPYQDYYTPALRDFVAELAAEVIDRFGYTFQGTSA